MKRLQVFLDMDGVLADFDARFEQLSGMRPEAFETAHGSTEFWRIIDAEPRYFADLEPMADAFDLYNGVAHLRPIILTGCPQDPSVPVQKREWAERYFPGVPLVCTASAKKRQFCQPGDVLIDDWLKYRDLWIKAGGRFIHHTSAETSLAVLFALYPDLRRVVPA